MTQTNVSFRALQDLDRADLNKDGRIGGDGDSRKYIFFKIIFLVYKEWLTYYHKHAKDTRNLLPAIQVLLYEPNYSCNPPAIFILLLSILQVCMYRNIITKLLLIPDGFLLLELASISSKPPEFSRVLSSSL